jgi:hypothetical protein
VSTLSTFLAKGNGAGALTPAVPAATAASPLALTPGQANSSTPPPAGSTSPLIFFGVAGPLSTVTQGYIPIRDTAPFLDGGSRASSDVSEGQSPSLQPLPSHVFDFLSLVPSSSEANPEDLFARIAAMTLPDSASALPALDSGIPGDIQAAPAAAEATPPVTDPAPRSLPDLVPSDGQDHPAPPPFTPIPGAIGLFLLGGLWWTPPAEELASEAGADEKTPAQRGGYSG